MSRYAFAAVAALSGLFATSAAMAANTAIATGNLTVQLVVVAGCTVSITTPTVSIGAGATIYPTTPVAGLIGTGTVTSICPTGTNYGLTLGSAKAGFSMAGGIVGNTTTIPYTVTYSGITSGGGSSTLTPNVSAVLHNVITGSSSFTAGAQPQAVKFTFTAGTPSAALVADTYSDALTVTLTY